MKVKILIIMAFLLSLFSTLTESSIITKINKEPGAGEAGREEVIETQSAAPVSGEKVEMANEEVDREKGEGREGPQPDYTVETEAGICYGISRQYGFLISFDSGRTWEVRNEGLPKKEIYPFGEKKTRLLTALGADQVNLGRVAVTTTSKIYLSEDFGETWEELKPLPGGAYPTAVALSSFDKDALLVGTSFSGLYESRDRGKNWDKISEDRDFPSPGFNFDEEVSAVAYHPADPEQVIFACGFGKGLYILRKKDKYLKKLPLPEAERGIIRGIRFRLSETGETSGMMVYGESSGQNSWAVPSAGKEDEVAPGYWVLEVDFQDKTCLYSTASGELLKENMVNRAELRERDPAKAKRRSRAAGKFGLYVNYAYKQFEDHLSFIKKNGLNAIVVDFKNDSGLITYDTHLALPRKIGAVKRLIKIGDLLKKAKENGIYVIGRIVVFKDQYLYNYNKHAYAVWDREKNKPWGEREYWVDPYCREVWEYNISIAEELQELGVDEIQFDYIRFPTDGEISRIVYRHRTGGMEKTDALESFLAMARERITVPISIDLYGFNCWYRMEGLTGQNLELLSSYTDVICPMFYPSHFPAAFLPGLDYLERAERIYYEGTTRASSIINGQSIIRPYVQAFLLGKELKMNAATYSNYLLKQVEGTLAAPSSGFTLWNNSNRYYMVKKPLSAYLEAEEPSS